MISNLAGTNSDKIQLNRRVSSMTLLLKRQSTKDWIKEIHEELKRQAIEKKHLILDTTTGQQLHKNHPK